MAIISPTPNSQISMSDILSKMGLSTSYRTLNNVELSAMGGYPAASASAHFSLCVPYQVEALASLGSTGTGAPNANWTSSTTLWRPSRLSEFRNAYNKKPKVFGVTGATGSASTCTMYVSGYNSDAYTGPATPYYFFTFGSGSFTGEATWVVANDATGTLRNYGTVTGLGGSGVWTCYVQDASGCGNRSDISTTITY